MRKPKLPKEVVKYFTIRLCGEPYVYFGDGEIVRGYLFEDTLYIIGDYGRKFPEHKSSKRKKASKPTDTL